MLAHTRPTSIYHNFWPRANANARIAALKRACYALLGMMLLPWLIPSKIGHILEVSVTKNLRKELKRGLRRWEKLPVGQELPIGADVQTVIVDYTVCIMHNIIYSYNRVALKMTQNGWCVSSSLLVPSCALEGYRTPHIAAYTDASISMCGCLLGALFIVSGVNKLWEAQRTGSYDYCGC